MTNKKQEKRESRRYKTNVEIYFDFVYDLKTKIKFELIDQEKALSKKYPAVSRNVSTEGLCFVTQKELEHEDLLHLEVYLPSAKNPIHMKGKVVWCEPTSSSLDEMSPKKQDQQSFNVGVRVVSVNETPVHQTAHHDEVYDVDWSIVLESVFGNYRLLMDGKHKTQLE